MRGLRRHYILVFSLFLLFSAQIRPQAQQGTQPSSGAASSKPKPNQSQQNCTNNGTYVNSKGQTVRRPENCSSPPIGATAQCRDGTYSFSQSRQGTCSHHDRV